MDILVLPDMTDEAAKSGTQDELPKSAAGETIMTTEPKFIPKDVAGHLENDAERMVKTPWYDTEIPFTKAAEIGTYKVIHEHSNIGFVITTDGFFGEIERKTI